MIKKIIRFLLAGISLIFLIWFLVPLFWRIWHIGNIVGVILCIALFFRTAFCRQYNRIKLKMCRRMPTKILLRTVQTVSVLVLIYAVAVSSFMIYAMVPWQTSENATAVVLGAQVKPWGPSSLLRQRIDAADLYLKKHPKAAAVVTGGKGADEPMSEAQCMYENLVKNGIAPERIYREDQAKNTEENIRYSLAIIKKNQLDPDIAVVSDSYHQLRAKIIAYKNDSSIQVTPVNTVNTHPAGFAAYPSYFVREWIAIPVEFIK